MTSLTEATLALRTDNSSHIKYRPDIDGLRAIAVAAVVIYHAFPSAFPAGFIGVDIFFVISGFLISTILYDDIKGSRFSIIKFYERRINRIFPALAIIMATALIFGWLTLFADEFKQLGKHAAGGSIFISNILLWDESGYFDTTSDIKPLLHLWSLGIEEQFYIFWPIILWLSLKARISIVLTAVVLCAASFALNMMNITADQAGTFYLPHTRVWELLIGSILSFLVRQNHNVSNSFRTACSAVGLSMLATGFFIIKDGSQFPGWQAALPTVGTALIIYSGMGTIPNRIISTRLFVWVGLISYPLYLWHWPLLSFPRIILGETPPVHIRAIAVIAAVALATLTYFAIEKPLKYVTSKIKVLVLFGLMCGIGASGHYIYLNNGIPTRSAIVTAKEFNEQFVGPLWKYEKNDICLNRAGNPDTSGYRWWFCYQNKDNMPEIMIIGTSYANHFYPGLASLPELKSKTIMSIGACSIESGEQASDAPVTTHPCSGNRAHKERKLIDSIMDGSPNLKQVIIGGLLANTSQAYIDGVVRRIGEISARGVRVSIITPHITRPGELKNCYSRPLSPSPAECTLPVAEKNKIDENFLPLKSAILKKYPDTLFFNQNDIFCGNSECKLLIDDMPIYRDQYSHLSEYASKIVAARFFEWGKNKGVDLSE
jgi:peptidoglycan/LPS O-acetylase OafA/YrhL